MAKDEAGSKWIALIGAAAGVIAIAISAVSLSYTAKTFELAQKNALDIRSLQLSGFQAATTIYLNFDKLMIEQPDARAYLYDGMNINRDDSNYNRIASIADYQLDILDSLIHNRSQLGNASPIPNLNTVVKNAFQGSPIMCNELRQFGLGFTQCMRKLAAPVCATHNPPIAIEITPSPDENTDCPGK